MRALLRILPLFQVFVWRPLGRNVKFLFILFVRKPFRLPYIWIFTNAWWLDVWILLCDRILYIKSDDKWHLSLIDFWFPYHLEWLNILRTTAWMQRRGVHGCLTTEMGVCLFTWSSQTDVLEMSSKRTFLGHLNISRFRFGSRQTVQKPITCYVHPGHLPPVSSE